MEQAVSIREREGTQPAESIESDDPEISGLEVVVANLQLAEEAINRAFQRVDEAAGQLKEAWHHVSAATAIADDERGGNEDDEQV